MLSDSPNFSDISIILLVIWNLFLSIYVYQAVAKYKKLTKGTNNRNLEQVVIKLIDNVESVKSHVSQVAQNLIEFQKKSIQYLQKVSVLRFNPFEDSGGDQSFAVAVLDGEGNGFIVSSLHSRSGTRVYAKEIKNGKSQSHALTREEKEALDKALKRK